MRVSDPDLLGKVLFPGRLPVFTLSVKVCVGRYTVLCFINSNYIRNHMGSLNSIEEKHFFLNEGVSGQWASPRPS